MKLRRVKAIAVKESLQIVRDPRSLMIALLIPLMQMFMLGYGINLDIKHIPLCTYDRENSQQSLDLLKRFAASRYFAVRKTAQSYAEITRDIDDGSCTHCHRHSRRLLAGPERRRHGHGAGADRRNRLEYREHRRELRARGDLRFFRRPAAAGHTAPGRHRADAHAGGRAGAGVVQRGSGKPQLTSFRASSPWSWRSSARS